MSTSDLYVSTCSCHLHCVLLNGGALQDVCHGATPFHTILPLQKTPILIKLLLQNHLQAAVFAGYRLPCPGRSIHAFRRQEGTPIQALQPQQQATCTQSVP